MAGAGERGGAGRGPAGGAPGAAALLALLLGGAALAWALRAAGGGPRAPDAAHLRAVLSGTELAASDLAAGASALAWAVLGYLALSVGLRLALLAAGRLSGGARWARAGLRLSTLVTVPAVRRLVDGGVGGTLLAASWLPLAAPPGGAPDAAYAAAAPAPEAHAAWAGARPAPGAPAPEALPAALYTVAPGDDLWEIARRVHADGSRWVEIASANPGLQAPGEGGGEPLRPGRVLRVPLGDRGARSEEGVTSYRVRRGDHLWGIAERFLGDGFRWVEIWERNRGREMADGSRLTDPDRLRPGWVLELPLRLAPGGAPPEEAAAGAAAEGAAEPGPSVPEAGPAGAGGREWPRAAAPALLAAAGVAGAGGAAVVVRRLARHGRLPRRGRGGEDERPGDAAHVSLACRYLAGALADAGFGETRPLLVEESAERINVTARTPVGDAPELGSRGPELERRLGCPLAVEPAGPARVRITLRGFSPRHALFAGEPPGPRHAPIVPVGSRREGIAYLNLGAVGLVTVRGEAAGRRALLRSWLETLASTHAPDELAIRLDRETAEELGTDAADAHAGGARPPDAADLARELSELLAVRAGGGGSERPLAAFLTPGEGGDELVSELREAGPARGVSVVRSLPAGGDEGEGEPGTATVHAGGDGAIEIRLGRDAPIHLDAVTVRRGEPAPSSGGGPREAGGGALAGSEEGDPGAALRPPGRDAGGEAPATGRGGAGETGGAAAGGQDDPAGGPGGGGGAGGQDDPAGGPGGGAGGQDDPPGGPGGGAGGQDDPPGGPGGGGGAGGQDDPPGGPGGGGGAGGQDDPPGGPGGGGGAGGQDDPAGDPDGGGGASGQDDPAGGPGGGAGGQGEAAGDPATGGEHGPLFRIQCLGPFRVWVRGRPLEGWRLERAREMLAMLAVEGGAAVARDRVADALWPDGRWDRTGQHNLSNIVTQLRRILRDAAAGDEELQPLIAANQRLRLPAELVSIDAAEFDETLRRAAAAPTEEAVPLYERALRLYAGDLLEGELYGWAEAYRSAYRRKLVAAARTAAGIAEELGEPGRALRCHRAILDRDPIDEEAARGAMRALAASGDLLGVRRAYRELSQALVRELEDTQAWPAAETRALLRELTGDGADE